MSAAAEVQAALDRMAPRSRRGSPASGLVITVMNGGSCSPASSCRDLPFELELGYVHVRHYGRETSGGELVWIAGPHDSVTGRSVLLLDDILDEGHTLVSIAPASSSSGRARCCSRRSRSGARQSPRP